MKSLKVDGFQFTSWEYHILHTPGWPAKKHLKNINYLAFRNNYTFSDNPTYLLGIRQIQVVHNFYKLFQVLGKPGIVAFLLPDTAFHLTSKRAELESVLTIP